MKRRFGIQLADGMQAPHELAAFGGDALQRGAAHARHDPHVQHDVGAVGDLHAAARVGRIDGAHAVGHDIQRAALHAALEQRVHLRVRFGRRHPVVVRAGVFLAAACR